MPDLRPGDEVVVETVRRHATPTGSTPTRDALVVPFTGIWVLDPLPKNPTAAACSPRSGTGQRLITLTTCSEIFHTDNRMIVFGHLVEEPTRQGPG